MKLIIKYFIIVCFLWVVGVLLGIAIVNNYENPTAFMENEDLGGNIEKSIIEALNEGDQTIV